jgi:8-oxo-dGTP pyrophosphatase MutT (NUDIX family)
MGGGASAKIMKPLGLPKRRQQVAAVCFRIRKRGIEFLLVQTRGGRWIFPKGGVEPGLTRAQSAALEAFEEAGVHGRMEEIPFARYFRRKRDLQNSNRTSGLEFAVAAHLCEVSRLEAPQESNRNPTWFAAEKAKQRLLEDRASEFGVELGHVVDRALSRIQRLHNVAHHTQDRAPDRRSPDHRPKDPLQKVRFEASEDALPGYIMETVARNFLGPRAGAKDQIRGPILRLSAGAGSPAEIARKITAIDSGRKANLSKPGKLVGSRTDRSSD